MISLGWTTLSSLRQEQRQPQERGGGAPHALPTRGSPAEPAATGDAEPARATRWLGVERVLDISI